VSNWGTPVELTGSAASRLKAELFKRGVLPLGVNMRCTSPGRMSLSVRVEDEMILREALEALGAAAPPASGDSQLSWINGENIAWLGEGRTIPIMPEISPGSLESGEIY